VSSLRTAGPTSPAAAANATSSASVWKCSRLAIGSGAAGVPRSAGEVVKIASRPARGERPRALSQDRHRVGEEEEHDRHRHGGERGVSEREPLGLAQHDLRAGSPLASELDHLLAVIEAGDDRPGGGGVTQQQAAAAANVEQTVAGL
jgi:hypothetical protein